jgi:uncharacterized SAM-binding protein YcdF (DUF218 family)
MQPLIDALKTELRPSSLTFLVTVLSIGVLLSFIRRTQRISRWYFAALLALFWIGSAPACAERLMRWQSGKYPPVLSAADARGATVVVVLGAGNVTIQAGGRSLNQLTWTAALRVLEGARLYHLLDHPTVIVSGGITRREEGWRSEAEALRKAVLELGVPADHIVVEAESQTTRDEARVIASMLAGRERQPIVLVTSPTHMPRSLAVFRAAGLDPIPSVAPYKSEHSLERFPWAPSEVGFVLFDNVVYDTMSTLYYRLRGWTHD